MARADALLEAQIELIFAALFPGNRLVLQTMLRTGLRISDVLELKRSQIARQFWITEGKTGKRRQVGLPDWLITEIMRYSDGSIWAFPSPKDVTKHRSRQAVWKDLKRCAEAFRVPVNVGTHSMRKTFAVDLMNKYGDISVVQRALNHDSPTVTMVYVMADKLAQTAAARRPVTRPKRPRKGGGA